MKKISLLLVVIMLGATALIAGCSCRRTDWRVIRVNQVTHSIFYAPMYAAINLGFFYEEDIIIELDTGNGADRSMAALISNSADIGLMGPEAAIFVARQGGNTGVRVFGQLTKRDGSFLIGRNPIDNFTWSMLENQEVIVGRRGGAPAMTFEYAVNQNGLFNGTNINLNFDVQFANTIGAFMAGVGDFVTAFEPAASAMVAAGGGHIIASVGQEAGEVPFTAFMATDRFINNNPERIEAFLRALIRGYEFLINADIEDAIDAVAPSFVGTPRIDLKNSILAYRAIDAWNASPVMTADAYYRLISIMMNAGELEEAVPMNLVVDNSFAERVMQQLATA